MVEQTSNDWPRLLVADFQVAVANQDSGKLAGVREGFETFFADRSWPSGAFSVRRAPDARDSSEIQLDTNDVQSCALDQVLELRSSLGELYSFYVACETGLHSLPRADDELWFVHSWVAIASVHGPYSCGSSGWVQLPSGLLSQATAKRARFVPGRRRSGGMAASITGGVESQPRAAAVATRHALASLLFDSRELAR